VDQRRAEAKKESIGAAVLVWIGCSSKMKASGENENTEGRIEVQRNSLLPR
jgi:hypothetical protein